jgi:hypothetical protein
VPRAADYTTLPRLAQKGLGHTFLGAPRAVCGGTARRLVRVARTGLAAVRSPRAALSSLWEGAVPGLEG